MWNSEPLGFLSAAWIVSACSKSHALARTENLYQAELIGRMDRQVCKTPQCESTEVGSPWSWSLHPDCFITYPSDPSGQPGGSLKELLFPHLSYF